jgi:RND family efflux transporter MFP subunit
MLLVFVGCKKEKVSTEKTEHPAEVHNLVTETSLTTITLTSKAEQRLGIETTVVECRSVERSRTFGGEVVPVSGGSVTVTAPLSGTLLPPENSPFVTAGSRMTKDQPIFLLLLALPRQDKDILTVQEEISVLQAELDLAQKKAKRAQQLYNEKAGSAKELEEAQADLAGIKAGLKTARTRFELLQSGDVSSQGQGLSSVIIKSPIEGIVQDVHVASGQTVTDATALLEISNIDPVWIKVPVYAGDVAIIEPNEPARVHGLNDFTGMRTRIAQPVVASFSADPESGTVDMYYEISNSDLSYRPGQRVSVTLKLKTNEQNLVVPYAAILYDMYGGAWVYEHTESRIYTRRRVEIKRIQGNIAVLSRGLEAGTQVVTAGAAELFGTEFGEAGH